MNSTHAKLVQFQLWARLNHSVKMKFFILLLVAITFVGILKAAPVEPASECNCQQSYTPSISPVPHIMMPTPNDSLIPDYCKAICNKPASN